jgi:hypothetical protein
MAETLRASSNRDAKPGTLRGLIGGLSVGVNTLTRLGKIEAIGLGHFEINQLSDHGPILSGPHLTPYECRTVESGLGQPLDSDCSAAQKVEYFYRASSNSFKPLKEPFGPNLPISSTRQRSMGRRCRTLWRVDSGTINRSIYRIAILDDPTPEHASGQWVAGTRLEPAIGRLLRRWRRHAIQSGHQSGDCRSQPSLSRAGIRICDLNGAGQPAARQRRPSGETLMMLKEYFIRALWRA